MVTPSEISEAQEIYPRLQYDISRKILAGELDFSACWHKDKWQIEREIPLDGDSRLLANFIEDSHSIEISLAEPDNLGVSHPKVIAADTKRISSIIDSLRIPMIDLHIFDTDRSCCLMLGQPKLGKKPLPFFIGEAVVPFFYRISYVERHGLEAARRELWGEYSHGTRGLQEWLLENDLSQLKNIRRNEPCICGSNLKFKKCCIQKLITKRQIERRLQNIQSRESRTTSTNPK